MYYVNIHALKTSVQYPYKVKQDRPKHQNQSTNRTTKGQVYNMKVRLEKEDKKYFTLDETPIISKVIDSMKEDDSTPNDYANIAIQAAFNGNAYNIEILKASAKIAKNCRVSNAYSDDSADIDVWVEATAYVNCNEFIMIGAYLSDIWQITGDNQSEIASQMYIRKFKEVKSH